MRYATLKETCIYGLVENSTGTLFYVGATREDLDKRLKQHLRHARSGHSPVDQRISRLEREHDATEIFVIQNVAGTDWSGTWAFWVDYFRSVGSELVPSEAAGLERKRLDERRAA
jgi:hypothetical protein